MIEVGDMILYASEYATCENDIGWVVHTETHRCHGGLRNLIIIKWLLEDGADNMWEDSLKMHKEFVIVKGGQHGQ